MEKHEERKHFFRKIAKYKLKNNIMKYIVRSALCDILKVPKKAGHIAITYQNIYPSFISDYE